MFKKQLVSVSKEEKEQMLLYADIDRAIKPLCDAINSIPCLVTMNSCQGTVYGDILEQLEHCPKTYVDFYVVGDNPDAYDIADNLMTLLSIELADELTFAEAQVSVQFEPEGYLVIRNNRHMTEYTKDIRKRYQVLFYDAMFEGDDDEDLLEAIRHGIRERVDKATELVLRYKNEVLLG